MGALIFVGIVCFIFIAASIFSWVVIQSTKPRLSADKIKKILVQYQDDYGEFHFHECAAAIEERLNP